MGGGKRKGPRQEPRTVCLFYFLRFFCAELLQRRLQIARVPEHDGGGHQTEGMQWIFLPLARGFLDFPALAVPDRTGDLMAARASVEWGQSPPPIVLGSNVVEQVDRLVDPSPVDHSWGQAGWPLAFQERAAQVGGVDRTEFEGASDAEHVLPVLADTGGPDAMVGTLLGGFAVVVTALIVHHLSTSPLDINRDLWDVATPVEREQIRTILFRSDAPLVRIFGLIDPPLTPPCPPADCPALPARSAGNPPE